MGTEQHVSNLLTFCVLKESNSSVLGAFIWLWSQPRWQILSITAGGWFWRSPPHTDEDTETVCLERYVFKMQSEKCQIEFISGVFRGFSTSSVCPLDASGSHLTLHTIMLVPPPPKSKTWPYRVRLCTNIIIQTKVQRFDWRNKKKNVCVEADCKHHTMSFGLSFKADETLKHTSLPYWLWIFVIAAVWLLYKPSPREHGLCRRLWLMSDTALRCQDRHFSPFCPLSGEVSCVWVLLELLGLNEDWCSPLMSSFWVKPLVWLLSVVTNQVFPF